MTKDNYAVISNSPELINLNFYFGNPNNKDWLHINAIAYNEKLNQIVLSNHNFSEIWVLDHSTTTIEAASHSGGVNGKGGDLLYRWGNPQTYDQGTSSDQLLFKQHDSYWIEDSLRDGGLIMVFNNQAGNTVDYSTVNIIDPPIDNDGNYIYTGSSYGPSDFHWTYKAEVFTDFYAQNISGASRLPNGNTLICEGTSGRFFEVDYSGNTVWEYVNPVKNTGPITQGSTITQNPVFRSLRYAPDYPGFDGQTLTQQGYIEPGSTFTCDLFTTGINDLEIESDLTIYPNPCVDIVHIQFENSLEYVNIEIFNIEGQSVYDKQWDMKEQIGLDLNCLNKGIYFIQFTTAKGTSARKLIVQ